MLLLVLSLLLESFALLPTDDLAFRSVVKSIVAAVELVMLAALISTDEAFVLQLSFSTVELLTSTVPAKIRPTRPNDVILCMLIASFSIIRKGCDDRCGAKTPSTELFC